MWDFNHNIMIMVERKSKKRKDKVASIISKVMVIFTLDTLACISGNLETETADMISKKKIWRIFAPKILLFRVMRIGRKNVIMYSKNTFAWNWG